VVEQFIKFVPYAGREPPPLPDAFSEGDQEFEPAGLAADWLISWLTKCKKCGAQFTQQVRPYKRPKLRKYCRACHPRRRAKQR